MHCIIYWINDRGAFAVLKEASGPIYDGRYGICHRGILVCVNMPDVAG